MLEKQFIESGGYFEKCKIEDFFTIKGNPQLDKDDLRFSDNSSYPYFTRTVFNNGIYGYVDYYDEKHLIKGNSIAVGMMGMQFFYMAHDFYAGQFTKTAFPKFEGLNWRVALWFISWFNKSSKWYLGLLVRDFEKAFGETEIIVPRNSDGSLSLTYMESRIREMEESRIREMEAYLKVAGFENCELTEEEKKALMSFKTKRTKKFSIGALYDKEDIRNSSFDKKKDTRLKPDGIYNIPLVNAKNGDNGIMFYGHKDKFASIEMSIDIVQNGAVATGNVYPQPQKTGVLWDAYLIKAINRSDTRESLMFISSAIRKCIKKKFSYECKATWNRVSNEYIWLPVTSSGSIDYKFMETYIRAIEKQIIQRVKDWRAKEIKATMDIVKDDTESSSLKPLFGSKQYEIQEEDVSVMVADNIFIPYSVEIRLWDTKREDLFEGNLDLLLMYAIGPSARHKTESACKIALGIKETNLSAEAIKAFKSVRYIMFHYWKNSEATPFELTAPIRLVSKQNIPDGFLIRQEKDAKQYLLIEYNSEKPAELGEYDILKAQRRGSNRYIPFVCRVENIKVNKNDRQE